MASFNCLPEELQLHLLSLVDASSTYAHAVSVAWNRLWWRTRRCLNIDLSHLITLMVERRLSLLVEKLSVGTLADFPHSELNNESEYPLLPQLRELKIESTFNFKDNRAESQLDLIAKLVFPHCRASLVTLHMPHYLLDRIPSNLPSLKSILIIRRFSYDGDSTSWDALSNYPTLQSIAIDDFHLPIKETTLDGHRLQLSSFPYLEELDTRLFALPFPILKPNLVAYVSSICDLSAHAKVLRGIEFDDGELGRVTDAWPRLSQREQLIILRSTNSDNLGIVQEATAGGMDEDLINMLMPLISNDPISFRQCFDEAYTSEELAAVYQLYLAFARFPKLWNDMELSITILAHWLDYSGTDETLFYLGEHTLGPVNFLQWPEAFYGAVCDWLARGDEISEVTIALLIKIGLDFHHPVYGSRLLANLMLNERLFELLEHQDIYVSSELFKGSDLVRQIARIPKRPVGYSPKFTLGITHAIRRAIELGCRVDNTESSNGFSFLSNLAPSTPVFCALMYELLKAGASPQQLDIKRNTLLHVMADLCFFSSFGWFIIEPEKANDRVAEIVRLCRAQGVGFLDKNEEGKTVFDKMDQGCAYLLRQLSVLTEEEDQIAKSVNYSNPKEATSERINIIRAPI